MKLGAKLRQLRHQRGLSQEELARRAKITKAALIQYEQGRREPRWSTFVSIAMALEAPLDAFTECVASLPSKPGPRLAHPDES